MSLSGVRACVCVQREHQTGTTTRPACPPTPHRPTIVYVLAFVYVLALSVLFQGGPFVSSVFRFPGRPPAHKDEHAHAHIQYVCVRACARMRECVCACARVRMCACAHVRVCVCAGGGKGGRGGEGHTPRPCLPIHVPPTCSKRLRLVRPSPLQLRYGQEGGGGVGRGSRAGPLLMPRQPPSPHQLAYPSTTLHPSAPDDQGRRPIPFLSPFPATPSPPHHAHTLTMRVPSPAQAGQSPSSSSLGPVPAAARAHARSGVKHGAGPVNAWWPKAHVSYAGLVWPKHEAGRQWRRRARTVPRACCLTTKIA